MLSLQYIIAELPADFISTVIIFHPLRFTRCLSNFWIIILFKDISMLWNITNISLMFSRSLDALTVRACVVKRIARNFGKLQKCWEKYFLKKPSVFVRNFSCCCMYIYVFMRQLLQQPIEGFLLFLFCGSLVPGTDLGGMGRSLNLGSKPEGDVAVKAVSGACTVFH